MLCPHSSHGLWCGEWLVSHPQHKGGGVIEQTATSNGFGPLGERGFKRFWVGPESEAVFGLGFSKVTPCSNTHLLWKNHKHRSLQLVLQGSFSD